MKLRKIAALTLSGLMAASLTACVGDTPTQTTAATAAATEAAVTAAEESKDETAAPEKAEDGSASSVKIGCIFPISGGSAEMGNLFKLGIQMAVDEFNDNGGVKSMGGASIELVWADSAGDPATGVTEIERLIVEQDVDCLLGPYNSNVGASTAPVAERYGVPYLLTNSNVDSILTNDYKYVFRANHANSDAAKNMVDQVVYMGEKNGSPVQSVAIVAENSDWGIGMAEALKPLCEAAGIKCDIVETFSTNAADMSNIVIKLKEAKPDIVFAMCYLSDAQLLTTQMKEYGVKSTIFADGAGFVTSTYLESAGDLAEGNFATAGWDVGAVEYKGAAAAALNDKFKTDYSGGQDLNEFSASGWLNASVMLSAIERAGSADKEAIREALQSTDIGPNDHELSLHAYEGIKFGEVRGMTNQNIYSGKLIIQVQDGKYVLIGPNTLVTEDKFNWPVEH